MLYVLAGPDDFSLEKSLEEIKRGLGDPSALAMCTEVLDGQQVAPDELKNACETVPFFSDKRLVIIKGLIERVDSKQKAGASRTAGRAPQPDAGLFADCLTQLPETTAVILIESEIPKNTGVFRQLSPKAEVRTFPILKESALRPWIQKRVAEVGGSMSPQATEVLAQLVGSNLLMMANEIDKLMLFCKDRRIEEADVRSLVGYAQDISVFALIDAIVDFKAEQAGGLLQRLLLSGAAATYLLYMLDRQFRMIIMAKEMKARKKAESDIQSRLGLHNDYAFKRTLEQANRYSASRLRQIYRQLLDADVATKTGRYPDDRHGELALSLLVADLCRRPQAKARIGAIADN